MEKYKVTVIKDCHAAHNVSVRNLASLEKDSVVMLAKKSNYLVSVRREAL